MNPFTERRNESVASLGEEALIAQIRRWLGSVSPRAPSGIGDDCAVLPAAKKTQLLTVDPVVYDRHFDASASPGEVGAKLLKRNLSDLAAMGGRPKAAVVSLLLDGATRRRWLEQFYRGLAACARRYDVSIVGGDVAEAKGVVAASLTLLGEVVGQRAVTRTGARLHDWIYVTGVLGRSLSSGHHLKFAPRLAEGAWLARHREVRAMMDLSDGLAKDLDALTPKGTVAAVDGARVPRRLHASLAQALGDGEDYELIFALAAKSDRERFARAWKKTFPKTPLSCLGRFVRPRELPAGALRLADYSGYEHLK
jgi:thiamine-monophosphate kinase